MKITDRVLLGVGLAAGAYFGLQALVRQSRWFSFPGRVVVISGGSRGLGIVLARQLIDAGAKVALCARTEDDVHAAVRELTNRGGEAFGGICDVRDQEQVAEFVRQVHSRWGRIDVLLNVAGIMQVGPLDAMTIADFRTAMDINCWGALHTTLAVLPTMRRQKWGRIVNIASIGGKRAVPHMLPYDTSKFALVGLSTGLRTELAKDGILVTTACPSLMRTGSPRNATFKGKHREEYAWFSIGGSLPVVAMDAERAAAQVLRACQNGDGEVYITNFFSPPVWASQLAPALTNDVLALVNYPPRRGSPGKRCSFPALRS
jgi:NAD(P)-dependent dehydrogenase (short-subunit alcohol dehydrogenase family)